MQKSLDTINDRIRDGTVRVVTAEEMPNIVDELGEEGALKEVDVVTTGTFGAMCSSGAFFNFGHADPPIRMQRVWLNDVEAYAGLAAVDAYIGAAADSETRGSEYGGAHVIEDFIAGKYVELRASSTGTDCYPRKTITTELLLEELNQAIMVNPRNSFQKYDAATNTGDEILHTYMGTLLPGIGNVSFSGSGVLSPLANDPAHKLIGSGTPLFLCGAEGMVVGEGTQTSPSRGYGTIMTTGDMNEMDTKFCRAATFTGYGASLYVGVGVPIPVCDLETVRATAIRDEDITTSIIDYSVPSRDRPTVKEVTYAELRSGRIDLGGEEVRTSSMSSFAKAREVAEELKGWIETGKMECNLPVRRVNAAKAAGPIRQTHRTPRVREIMNGIAPCIRSDETVKAAAKALMKGETNHLPVTDNNNQVVGIVTTYDTSKAIVLEKPDALVSEIMSRKVVVTNPNEAVDVAAMKLKKHNISALPVVDENGKPVGMLTAIDLGKLFGGKWKW